MSSSRSQCNNRGDTPLPAAVAEALAASGAAVWGLAPAGAVDPAETEAYDAWIAAGHGATMDYLADHAGLRAHTDAILPGARTAIVCGFLYAPARSFGPAPALPIASYALGSDYHHVVKARLAPVAEALATAGHSARICVDSAPLAERYLAVRARLGYIGRNCMLNVADYGSRLLLGTILTDLELPHRPHSGHWRDPICHGCFRCVMACPTHALRGDGTMDARRCLNYLTIEHRGDLPDGTDLHGRVFGCDACVDACPRNRHTPVELVVDELRPHPATLALDAATLRSLSSSAFNRRFRLTPLSRPGLKLLRRNLDNCIL